MNKGKKAQKVVAKQEAFNPKNYEKNGLTEDEVEGLDEETIEKLLKSKWWDLSDEDLEKRADNITNVHAFLKELERGK